MAEYEAQTWVDGLTPVSAARLNHMEQGIAAAAADSGTGEAGTLDPEQVRDTIANALTEGNNIDIAVDDAGDTLTISTPATVNQTDAYLIARGNHTGTQPTSTITDFAETVRDTVAAFLVQGANVTLTHNDAGDTLTVAASGGDGTIDNAVLQSKVAHPTTWAATTAYNVGDYVIVNSTGVIFRVMTAHTSGSTAPTVATAQPTDPASNYYVWAAPGNSPGSLVRRNNSNEVTLEMLYILDAPTAPTAVANLAYVDAAVAAVTPPPRPSAMIPVVWNGSAWTYRGVVITAQPTDREAGDVVHFIGNASGSLPAWAVANDVWTQGG